MTATEVIFNTDGSITYAVDFTKSSRLDSVFTVDTVALGTSFNIRAYPHEPDIKISLVKKDQYVNQSLGVGEVAAFDKTFAKCIKHKYDPPSVMPSQAIIMTSHTQDNLTIFLYRKIFNDST